MSWGIEFRRRGATEFKQNSVRLALKEEATSYGRDLSTRMVIAEEHKVVEYPGEPANYYWSKGRLKPLIRDKHRAKPEPEPPKQDRKQILQEQITKLQETLEKATGYHIRRQVEEGIAKLRKELADAVLSGG